VRNRAALIAWALMTILILSGIGVIIWRMITLRGHGGGFEGTSGFSLAILAIAAGNSIRMTRAAWVLHRQRRR